MVKEPTTDPFLLGHRRETRMPVAAGIKSGVPARPDHASRRGRARDLGKSNDCAAHADAAAQRPRVVRCWRPGHPKP